MLLECSSPFSISNPRGLYCLSSFSICNPLLFSGRICKNIICGAGVDARQKLTTGTIFQPFEEVKRAAFIIPSAPNVSLARQDYSEKCESALNEQINVEYNVSYIYHSLYAYFDRDDVALKGMAKFFQKSSEEEREHAEKMMKYQNKRGGRVKMYSVLMPPQELDHGEKGSALHAMELVLSLEKLTNEKLLNLHKVACAANDPQMSDFLESEFLNEQVESIKKISEYVSQLRIVGKGGHGLWHFDQKLLTEAIA